MGFELPMIQEKIFHEEIMEEGISGNLGKHLQIPSYLHPYSFDGFDNHPWLAKITIGFGLAVLGFAVLAIGTFIILLFASVIYKICCGKSEVTYTNTVANDDDDDDDWRKSFFFLFCLLHVCRGVSGRKISGNLNSRFPGNIGFYSRFLEISKC